VAMFVVVVVFVMMGHNASFLSFQIRQPRRAW
jgi:hypothetical protein